MKLPPLRRTYDLPYPLSAVEEQVAQAIEPVLRQHDAQSLLYEGVTLVVGTVKELVHGLRQPPKGYRIVRRDGPAVVYDLQAANPHPERTLALMASEDVIVSLEIF